MTITEKYTESANEHLDQLVEAIKNHRTAQADFISTVMDAKLSKKDSESIRQKLQQINPTYWQVERQLKALSLSLKSESDHK